MFKIKTIWYLLLFCSITGYSQNTEFEIKAVALEKIALFIGWPGNATATPAGQFVIAVLDDPAFSETLREVYRNHKIKDHPVKVIDLNDVTQYADYQILYLPEMKKPQLLKILDRLKKLPVLTVGETDGYAGAGCYINFFILDGKLRFEINQKAMKSAGFDVDYKLLRVARVVDPVNI